MDGLAEHLKKNKITQRVFAQRLGISHEHLNRILRGHQKPSAPLAKLIEYEQRKETTE